jgi:hypothetical protein
LTPPAWLDRFCEWLKVTRFSVAIQSAEWVVPAVQTVHILAIGAVIGSGLMIALRALGLIASEQTLAAFSTRTVRVIWWALPVLLVTGILMISAEPARSLENAAFALKMGLLAVSILVNLGYQAPLKRQPEFWDRSVGRRRASPAIAIVSFLLWVGVIFSGRWIAYVQPS